MKTIVIEKNDSDQRLDKFLFKTFPNLPPSMVYKYIRKKRIKLNGKRCMVSNKLNVGDVLYLYINDEFLISSDHDSIFMSVSTKLNIIYEDSNILLIDKEPGLIVHEDEIEKVDTLINRVKKYLYVKGEYKPKDEQSFTPALVNRIDRNTRGIVIAAKNAQSLRILNRKLKNREIKKVYLCLVHGIPQNKSNCLKNYLIKNEKENRVFIFNFPKPNSKTILTKYKVIKSINNLSLLEIELLTGRTHQIRAHMAYIGHPLLGDTKYGTLKNNKMYNLTHQALVSYKIAFNFTSNSEDLNYLKNKSFEINNAEQYLKSLLNK